ncbi:hypothetical protein, partial [Cupriavidus sp. WS]|uniref:hypothetical protein n=1 Tax=Cupriavidus sp. WS TaxID=1312922 RepID=UPI001E4AAB1E
KAFDFDVLQLTLKHKHTNPQAKPKPQIAIPVTGELEPPPTTPSYLQDKTRPPALWRMNLAE